MTIPSLIPTSPTKPSIPAEPPSSLDSRGESAPSDRVRREMQLRRLREERDRLLAAEEQRKRKEEQEQRIRLEMERIRKKAEEKRRAEEEKRRIQAEEEKRRVEEITKQRREVEQRQLKERLELKREAERRRSPTPPPIVETENPENPAEDEPAPFRPQSPPKTVETGKMQGSTVSTVPPVSTAPMGSPARTGLLSSFAGFFSSRSPAKEETPSKDETPIKEETPSKKETPAKPLPVSQAPANPVTVSLNSRAPNSRGLGSPQSPAGNRKLLVEESRESLFTSIPLVNESFNPFASDSDVDSEGFPAIPMFENSMEDSMANPFGRESVVLRRLDAKSEASVEDSAEKTAGPVKLNPFDETPDVSPRNPVDQDVKRPSIVVNLNPTKEELKPNHQIVKLNPFDENETTESSPRNPFDEDVKPKQGVVKLNPFDADETPDVSPRNPFDEDVKPAKKETKLNPFDVDETPESSPRNPFDQDVKPKERVVKLNPFDETSDSLDMDVPQISPISLRESFSQLTSAAENRTQPAPTNPFETQTQTQSNSNSKEATETQTNTNQNEAENESNREEEEEEFTDDPEYANERRDLRSMFEVYQSNKNGRNESRR